MARLLIVDADPKVLYLLEPELRAQAQSIITAATGKGALELARPHPPDAVILDLALPDMPGLEVLEELRRIDPRLPVIVTAARARNTTTIRAAKLGAFECLLKPIDLATYREVLTGALALSHARHVRAVVDPEGTADLEADAIIGHCPAMHEVYKLIGKYAAKDVTVLLQGESGTGKELVARAIYKHSRRSQAPFLEMNCAAIPEQLLESELFGHEKGAFTGADRKHIGKFEQAHGGTIFLDEVGDLSAASQAKVLRVLQEQRFQRVGGSEMVRTDVRLIVATNHGLPALVETGRFRADLLYRVNTFTITLPPLRDRGADLPVLVDYLRRRFNRELGTDVRFVDAPALSLLEAYPWPGNVRELASAIHYAVLHARGDVLTAETLPETVRRGGPVGAPGTSAAAPAPADLPGLVRWLLAAGESGIYGKAREAFERMVLGMVLEHVGGNQVRASKLLGISRMTLRGKLRALGLLGGEARGPGRPNRDAGEAP